MFCRILVMTGKTELLTGKIELRNAVPPNDLDMREAIKVSNKFSLSRKNLKLSMETVTSSFTYVYKRLYCVLCSTYLKLRFLQESAQWDFVNTYTSELKLHIPL